MSYVLCARRRGHRGDHRGDSAHWSDFDHVADDLAIVEPTDDHATPALDLGRTDPDGGVDLAAFGVGNDPGRPSVVRR